MPYIIEFDSEPYEMDARDDEDAIRVARQFAGQIMQEDHAGRTSFNIRLWGQNDELLYQIDIEQQQHVGSAIRRRSGQA